MQLTFIVHCHVSSRVFEFPTLLDFGTAAVADPTAIPTQDINILEHHHIGGLHSP